MTAAPVRTLVAAIVSTSVQRRRRVPPCSSIRLSTVTASRTLALGVAVDEGVPATDAKEGSLA